MVRIQQDTRAFRGRATWKTATVQTSLKKGNLTRMKKWDGTRVLDVRHGRLHFQSERERTTILEGNVVERSNRSLIVPEPEELRQHWREEFDWKGTASEILELPGS